MASLKPARSGPQLGDLSPIPRPRGRGLIEAGSTTSACPVPVEFHDRAVVASLKPGDCSAGQGKVGTIPRPRGRGLIEACRRPRARSCCRKFHDRAVVASLKHANRGLESGQSRQFHDRAVVASLKHTARSAWPRATARIPRPRGRGLIEATP